MNAHASPNAIHGFWLVVCEMAKAMIRGLGRLAEYDSYKDCPEALEAARLRSAIDHLTRTEPVLENVFGEAYIERVNRADPAVLAATLKTLGYTEADVETWRGLYPTPAV